MREFFYILISCWFLNLFLPWWSALIPALLLGAWLFNKSLRGFIVGFTAAGMAWFLQALYIHIANNGIITGRIAETLGIGSSFFVLLITFFIGGLIGGLGVLLGVQIKLALSQPK